MQNANIRSISKSRILPVIVLLALGLSLSGCVLPFLATMDAEDGESDADGGHTDPYSETEITMITVDEPLFTLAWDAPEEEDTVDGYRVYFRGYGESEWKPLETTASDELQLEVNERILSEGPGDYTFAVRAIRSDGDLSEYHTSLSENANPARWYLNWEPST